MKNNSILKRLPLIIIIAGIIITGCSSAAEKAHEKVNEAKQNLNQALKDSIQSFRKVSDEMISHNDKIIAEFKTQVAAAKKELKAQYLKKTEDMELRNLAMKKRLAEYKEAENNKWDSFKKEFNKEMDDLGKSIKDFKVDDKK